MKRPNLIPTDWKAAIATLRTDSAEAIPDGFKTIKQIAAELGVCRRHAFDGVSRLVLAGMAEVRPFRLPVGNGGTRPVPHYRLTTPA